MLEKEDQFTILTSSNHRQSQRKRNDIQGLRGVAILSVLAFHLRPNEFPNGYLGVDIFFVLSGFLMSHILCRSPSLSFTTIADFYLRRFKRIVPLYAIMMATVTFFTVISFTSTDIGNFITDLEWALSLATNIQIAVRKVDYWTQIFDFPVLLHSWSLGVEIQYYLIVPFIIMIRNSLSNSKDRLIFFSIIVIGSFILHIIFSPMASFGLLPARVWQFNIGSISYELKSLFSSNEQVISNHIKNTLYIITLSIVCIAICLSPFTLYPSISRLVSSSIVGIIILQGSRGIGSPILNNKFLVYTGDISYIAYLVHWPLIVLFKYTPNVTELPLHHVIICLILTMLISIIAHHTIEQMFIKSDVSVAVLATLFVYMTLFSAISTGLLEHIPQVLMKHDNLTTEAIAFNTQNSITQYFDKPQGAEEDFEAVAWTNYTDDPNLRTYVRGNGTVSVLLVGNSYAYRAFPVLLRLFNGRFKEFRILSTSGCLILSAYTCYLSGAINTVIENQQPDITFAIAKDLNFLEPITVTNISEDLYVQRTQHIIDLWSNHTGRLVIEHQYIRPNITGGVAYTIAKRLQRSSHPDLSDLKMSYEEYKEMYKYELMRMNALKGGPNLILNKVVDQMCAETPGTCWMYNRSNLHSYYGDWDAHLTSEGLKLLEPRWSQIIDEFLLSHNSL